MTIGPEETAFLDSLIAKRVATTGDGPRVVTVPGIEDLTREQQLWIAEKIDKLDQEVPLDTDALFSKLETLKRSGDDAASDSSSSISCASHTLPCFNAEEALPWEEEAREKLEAIGLPPCYPRKMELPILKPYPEEHRGALAWFDLKGHQDELLLCVQLQHWEVAHKSVVERRKKYGVFREDDPPLRFQPAKQNLLQNWIEYQDYMFRELEKFEKMMNKDLELLGPEFFLYEGRVRQLKIHKNFLDWIEQQRPYIERKVKEAGDKKLASDSELVDETTKGNMKTSTLPKARVPICDNKRKAVSLDPGTAIAKRQSLRQASRKTPRPEPARKTKNGDTKTRKTKNDDAQPLKATITKATKRKQDSKQNVTPCETRTRSGRISRKPQRWTP